MERTVYSISAVCGDNQVLLPDNIARGIRRLDFYRLLWYIIKVLLICVWLFILNKYVAEVIVMVAVMAGVVFRPRRHGVKFVKGNLYIDDGHWGHDNKNGCEYIVHSGDDSVCIGTKEIYLSRGNKLYSVTGIESGSYEVYYSREVTVLCAEKGDIQG